MGKQILLESGTNWDYADLTRAAKEAGGPENFINVIYKKGLKDGVIISAGLYVISKLYQYMKQKKLAEVNNTNS